MGFLNNFCLKEFIFQKQKCQVVVCVSGCASSLCTSMFYIRDSLGRAKIRLLNDLVKLCLKYLTHKSSTVYYV